MNVRMANISKISGFTLIEILIAMAVVAILSASVLIGLNPIRAQARDARRISDLQQVRTGLELHFAKVGGYPVVTVGGNQSWDDLESALSTANIGVPRIPHDPQPGRTYEYSSDGNGYILKTTFESASVNLNEDIDNNSNVPLYGLDCDDPAYCISL